MGYLDVFFVPAAIRAARDQTRVRFIFHSGRFLFVDDRARNLKYSSFSYYLGLTGKAFNMDSISSYLLRYSLPRGMDLEFIGNAYADFAYEISLKYGEVYGDRDPYVVIWTNPTERGLGKNWEKDEYHYLFLDFAVYFLLDVLKLDYEIIK